MNQVSVRDLRNHGGEVLDRVLAGETLTVVKSGTPVAELRPLRSKPLTASVLIERWSRLPAIDVVALRSDIDNILDSSV